MRLLMLIGAVLLSAGCGTDQYALWGKYAETQQRIVDGSRAPAVIEANTAAFFALQELGEIVAVAWSQEEAPSCAEVIRDLQCQELEYGLRMVGGQRPVRMDGGGGGCFRKEDAEIIVRHLAFIRAHPVSLTVRSSLDAVGLTLSVRLRNNVGKAIIVDRELRIGLALVVTGVAPESAAQPGMPLAFVRVPAEVRSGLHDPTRSRFVSLEPGQAIERTISFSDGIACYRPLPGPGLPLPGQSPLPEETVCVLARSLIRSVDIIYDTTQREPQASLAAFTGRPSGEPTLTPLRLTAQVPITRSYLYEVPERNRQPTAAAGP